MAFPAIELSISKQTMFESKKFIPMKQKLEYPNAFLTKHDNFDLNLSPQKN